MVIHMKNTFRDCVTGSGRYGLFGLPATEELKGRTALLPDGSEVSFGTELAVKCDDDLFLADSSAGLLLVKELPDERLKALDAGKAASEAAALPEDLEGWTTDLCFASGYVLTAVFRNGTLTLSPSPEPEVVNVFGTGEPSAASKAPAPDAAPVTFALQAVRTADKHFLLRFPETGEIVFLNAGRFLLYALLDGRIAAGFVEVPARE